MRPLYENIADNLEYFEKNSSHISPHIHKAVECVYVQEGTLELGIGQEYYHMETGSFAIVFPDLIHHYQVFDAGSCRSVYLLASPALSGNYLTTLQESCPADPVLNADQVHPDILYALNSLSKPIPVEQQHTLYQAFFQIILARCLPLYKYVEKSSVGSTDLIYQTVSYIARHFTESVTLTEMAHDLGVSPYTLSRVFSSTFHMNFNQYLNESRLEYACSLLHYTSKSITEIYENAGFESQRTFNRVFKEEYHLSPREYRRRFSV